MSGFRRHRRSGACVATFTVFEADLLRSLAAQLIELLRNEAATTAPESDPLEAMLDFSGPTTAPEDPVLARLFPDAYLEDEESAGDFRRFTESALRDGKATAAAAVIDTLEESGLPVEPVDGVFIDVELDAAATLTWMRSFTDIAPGHRHPARGGGRRRAEVGRPARGGPPGAGARHLRLAGLPAGHPGAGRRLRAAPHPVDSGLGQRLGFALVR